MAIGEQRVRAGVVGAGHMGQYHILVYAELWEVDLVGVVDVDNHVGVSGTNGHQ